MNILIATPAPPESRAGNRRTALRWQGILTALGHQVRVETELGDLEPDLLIALHAWRSARSIRNFAERFPNRPLVVALTGTDAYGFVHSHPEETLASIERADRLVGLHDRIENALPPEHRHKLHVIRQSAEPVGARIPYSSFFHVAVIGHLRDEKDPLRPALAARLLPSSSKIQVHGYGGAHSQEWAERALRETRDNPRFRWHGDVTRGHIERVYRRTNLVVLPSRMEGGANVISESAVAGAPVLASEIEGSIGLLGTDYPGYFPVGDERALSALLLRAEREPVFLGALTERCQSIAARHVIEAESAAWAGLLAGLGKA